ncbi:MarR family winged helix-turn-helix transcriptional regulator [Sphingomonas profundi]|uniref:MarR family winged helix-turn-helix transcriptional regulator n=1 Tax=Alterirhizorhabdus profundi TaxID=2681549 RepID=UPI0012E86ADC|nr:MarR family transcriptional regulator [Sphingomonas profundi]
MAETYDRAEQYTATNSLGYLLRRAHKLTMQVGEESFSDEDLSFTQWVALIQLRDGLVDTCGALARCLGHDGGATTRMLDQLEERGLIARQRSTSDRRVIHLSLTPVGRDAANRLVPRVAGLWDMLMEAFTPEEDAMLLSLLRRLIDRLSAVQSGEARP